MAASQPVRGVIFDMDGTLVDSSLDFDAIRAELDMPRVPLLEAMEKMSPAQRRRAETVLLRHEEEAAANCTLVPGARTLLAWLAEQRLRTSLLTRNSRRSVEMILARHGLSFDAVRTRDDGAVKPSPAPVLALCAQMAVAPGHSWVVGDYLFDIEAGRAAGCTTVLLVHGPHDPPFADQADLRVRSLDELRTRLIDSGGLAP